MNCKQCQNLFVNALYDELSAGQKKTFDLHLQECENCAGEYRKMTAALKTMDQRAQEQPEPEFWNSFWDNLEHKLNEEKTPVSDSQKGNIWKLPSIAIPQWAFRTAAAVAILLLGIFLGKLFFGNNIPDHQTATPFAASETITPQQAQLDSRTQVYLERSKVLLMGLNNLEPAAVETNAIDFTRYRHVSRDLVQEAGYLKNALESDPRQRRLRELVGDLEVILLQIANLEAENDVSGIELVKSGVDRRGILLKINLEEIRRGDNTIRPERESTKSTI